MQKNPLIQEGAVVTVLGLGISGMAALRYALKCGAKVRISDQASYEQITSKIEGMELGNIEIESGGHSYAFLKSSDLVFVSPGASCEDILTQLEADDVLLVGELSLAATVDLPPVVAITGTNGKTTVTSLVGELLAAGGNSVYVGGNIGYPLLDYLCSEEVADYLVLELSSFQLEQCGAFAPHIGLLLNITPDHLDRHGDMDGYKSAKMELFARQKATDFALYLSDDVFCFPEATIAERVGFGVQEDSVIKVVDAGFSFEVNGHNESYNLVGTPFNNRTGKLNAAPASYVARLLGVSKDNIENVLRGFDLGEHRMELCGVINDVSYYNDSKATNTGAVISGLSQLGQTVLIAGGKDKGDDYRLLEESVREKVTCLILIGEATPLIEKALSHCVSLYKATSLEDALTHAHTVAQAGQAVLFAPACSSFDMFANYKDRGEKFKAQVQRLKSM